jgi:hypothetical protein
MMMTTDSAASFEESGEDHPGEEGHEAQVHGQELLMRHEQAAQHAVDGAQGDSRPAVMVVATMRPDQKP